MDTDAVCRDLKRVQHLKWKWRKGKFDEVELLRHPEVERRAATPIEGQNLLDALFSLLREARDRVARREESEAEKGAEGESAENSVAWAVGILLRLDKKPDRRDPKALQKEVARGWRGDRGHYLNWNTFRQHYEEEHILRPFALDVLALLDRRSGSEGSGGKEEEMLRHLRKAEDDRLRSILDEGKLEIKTHEEMLTVLSGVNNLTTLSLRAVDRTPIEHWMKEEESLPDYLAEQLDLVRTKGLSLERIYLVRRATLKDSVEKEHLIEFVQLHQDAKATILLCRAEVAARLGVFGEKRGMILADEEGEPMAVTGKLGDGEIGEALLFTREQFEIRRLRSQYRLLRNRILTHKYDDKLREELGLPIREE
jgi:hypothetical protein